MSRRKLENFVNLSSQGFKPASLRRNSLHITPHMVFNKREPQARLGSLPDNPFMVPTVIEDLKRRWNHNAILELVPSVHDILPNCDHYPWGNITEVVPGEADLYCANAARQSGAAVLTGDSDLLVHDLGPSGSVIFFNSIESNEGDTENGSMKIRATTICPNKIAKKLGVRSIQRFAFELKRDPYMNLGKVIQRAKENTGGVENNASYVSFLREYASLEGSIAQDNSIQMLDPKVSELYSQYTHPELDAADQPPVTYLPMLVEDHSRRCAWQEGIEIRIVAFSMLNLWVAPENRKDTVLEYSRRGTRVFSTPLMLLEEDDLQQTVMDLYKRLFVPLDKCGDFSALAWKVFAVQQILMTKDEDSWPTPGQLRKLLETGRRAEMLDWRDIHFNAQIQSVFYSLRILRQSMAVSSQLKSSLAPTFELLYQVLQKLPPMRVISHSISDVVMCAHTTSKDAIKNAVSVLFATREETAENRCSDGDDTAEQLRNVNRNDEDCIDPEEEWTPASKKKDEVSSKAQRKRPPKRSNNIYEMLGDAD